MTTTAGWSGNMSHSSQTGKHEKLASQRYRDAKHASMLILWSDLDWNQNKTI